MVSYSSAGWRIHRNRIRLSADVKNKEEKIMAQNENSRKKKGGRLKKAIKKGQLLPVKCNKEERKKIESRNKSVNLSVSQYMREISLSGQNSPETKSIEQAVYDTYKNETSEINYIPLLGIGYSLIQTRGQKEYEPTNHLGNVLATVSDKKIGVPSSSNSSLIDHYEPDIVSAQDYYPFGMLQPGRSYLSLNGDKYRYGFNGKENDNEVKGDGNQQDYGMRVYDPRLGRFLSVDPLTKGYPGWSPYPFAMNRPIDGVDLDGGEWMPITEFCS
jgi:RHS repeat-associated protein